MTNWPSSKNSATGAAPRTNTSGRKTVRLPCGGMRWPPSATQPKNGVGLNKLLNTSMERKMIIIAFATNTSKIIPRLLCRRLRHCAVITPVEPDALVMYQFTRPGVAARLRLHSRDLKILRAHGWSFVYVPGHLPRDFNAARAFTCVDMTKRALRIRAPHIQTPDGLYQYLRRYTL